MKERAAKSERKCLSGVYYQKCFICFVLLFLFRLSPCQVRFTFLNDSQWNYIWKCYKLWRNLLLLIEHCGMRLSMMWKIMRLRRRRVNSLWDRHHSSRHTRAEFHNYISHSKIFLIFLTTLPQRRLSSNIGQFRTTVSRLKRMQVSLKKWIISIIEYHSVLLSWFMCSFRPV